MEQTKTEEKPKTSVSIEDLKNSIDQLESRIDKTNSTKRVFWKGVLTGLGGAIGATIIFAILVSLISWIVAETQATWLQGVVESLRDNRFTGR